MTVFAPVSGAKGRLSQLIRNAEDEDVLFMRYGRAAAVIIAIDRYHALLDQIDDREDRLSIHERAGLTVDLGKLGVELGL
jgi:PHD/YefM family antitoxin component YafN of YafNO toxin-antitoxin module